MKSRRDAPVLSFRISARVEEKVIGSCPFLNNIIAGSVSGSLNT